jgi:hypothetical protein
MTLHHHYTQRGYTFRIDRIHNGEVYVVRWPENSGPDELGVPMRVPVAVWEQQMAGAVEITPGAPNHAP